MQVGSALWARARAAQMRWKWARRDDSSFQTYFDNDTPNRRQIRSVIDSYAPGRLYEFGCYSGPNLKGHDCEIWGSDINPRAIAFARTALPAGQFTTTGDLATLEAWLPDRIDLTLIISVCYTMEQRTVESVLDLLSRKSERILLGDNFENFDGADSQMVDGKFRHPWARILAPLGQIESRHDIPNKDYSLRELVVVKTGDGGGQ